MPTEREMILEQLEVLEEIVPEIDSTYARLTQNLKMMIPLLKKRSFNSDDQAILKDFLHTIHQELDQFDQLLRRGEGELEMLRSEIVRCKEESPEVKKDYAIAEAELWAVEQNLTIREKGLNHLNELVQLLDSILRVGEMTDFDERLLTEIVMDLKNIAG
jgi:chromosome segregation ATPase